MIYAPQISLLGILINEPVTAGTDVVLSVLAFFLAARIRTRLHSSLFNDDWRLFFLFIGLSTGVGSVAHGLSAYFSETWFNFTWMAMNLFAGVSVYFALKATIRYIRLPRTSAALLHKVNIILMVFFALLSVARNDFEIFKIHAGIGVVSIFVTFLTAWFRQYKGSGAVTLAFALSIMTVMIHSTQLSFSPWFNHKDLSHVFMMASLILVYRGMQLMSDSLRLSFRRM